MKVLNTREFSTKQISEASETDTPKCQIYINGTATDSIIDGALFEAAISFQDFYLVFTTNDCPYEETLNIYFLDQDLKILDQAILCWPYGTGSFTLLNVIQPDRIRFQYFTQDAWEITLHTGPQFFIPFLSEPRGVWRKLKFSYHFKVRAITAL